ncbi:hypothetical protein IHO40_03555 [Wolbachia endosymbiont of Mansonella ozzardi]|nr:hypothetical protein [Wolbachia endosymbiont of Mansonella ozzardi]
MLKGILSISNKTPILTRSANRGIEPPTIKGDKLEQYLKATIPPISPADPMAINVYDANFFWSGINFSLNYYNPLLLDNFATNVNFII